jgi:hypothetical protein
MNTTGDEAEAATVGTSMPSSILDFFLIEKRIVRGEESE